MDPEIHREAFEAARAAEAATVTVSAKLLDELLTATKDIAFDHLQIGRTTGVTIDQNLKARRVISALAAVNLDLRKSQ